MDVGLAAQAWEAKYRTILGEEELDELKAMLMHAEEDGDRSHAGCSWCLPICCFERIQ